MEHTEDMAVAKKIAMDHLAENPKYYSELKVSGTEKPQATSNEPGSPIKNISSDDVMTNDRSRYHIQSGRDKGQNNATSTDHMFTNTATASTSKSIINVSSNKNGLDELFKTTKVASE